VIARAAALLLAAIALTACGGERSAGRIVVATEAAYPPFESKTTEGTIVGFDVDLVRAAAREAGLEAEFVDQPFDGILPGLAQGKYDAAVSAMTITEERARVVDFTDPYFEAGQVIAVRADGPPIRGLADLAGKTIAIQRNTTGHRAAEKVPGAHVKDFDAIEPAFLELLARRADAVINDYAPTFLYAKEHPEVRIVGEPFTQESYGIAVRKGDAALLAKLNEGLRKVRASGEYDRLRAEWIGVERADEGSTGRTFVYLLRGLGLSLVLGACSLAVALVGGLAVALCRMSPRAWLRWPATAYVETIRGVPLLVLILWIYFGVISDLLGRVGIPLHWFPASVIAFGACYSAFIGETYRAGIRSVDEGQSAAARALGLSGAQAMRFVVLPQAVRNILPALGNEAIALFKDTSLATVIAVNELMSRGKQVAGREFRTMEVYTLVAVLYLATTLVFSLLQRRLERRLDAGAHRDPGPR
jgi:His/Glu/Gln/Arg/opine family amino acid ABC transporter permease subunit